MPHRQEQRWNKLTKAWKTRKSPGTLSLKKFQPGKPNSRVDFSVTPDFKLATLIFLYQTGCSIDSAFHLSLQGEGALSEVTNIKYSFAKYFLKTFWTYMDWRWLRLSQMRYILQLSIRGAGCCWHLASNHRISHSVKCTDQWWPVLIPIGLHIVDILAQHCRRVRRKRVIKGRPPGGAPPLPWDHGNVLGTCLLTEIRISWVSSSLNLNSIGPPGTPSKAVNNGKTPKSASSEAKVEAADGENVWWKYWPGEALAKAAKLSSAGLWRAIQLRNKLCAETLGEEGWYGVPRCFPIIRELQWPREDEMEPRQVSSATSAAQIQCPPNCSSPYCWPGGRFWGRQFWGTPHQSQWWTSNHGMQQWQEEYHRQQKPNEL